MGSLLPLLFALIAVTVIHAKHHRHRVPLIELNGADSLIGTLREDELILNTVPQLAIVSESGPVCQYEVTSSSGDLVPFEVQVLDRFTGSAVIRVKEATTLDCKKSSYELKIVAVKCEENVKSEPVTLKVTVKDTNNHEPTWEHPWYTTEVVEGKVHNEIIRVQAIDADCGHPYGEICEYEISNGLDKGANFEINKQGVIRNIRPLNHSDAHSYILTVVAHDCGQRKSKSALVTIKVKEACVEGLHDVTERLHYQPGQGSMKVMPKVQLKSCSEDSKCSVSSVTAEVSIHTSHVEDSCGRQNSPLYTNETMKECGLSTDAMAILDETRTFNGSDNEEEIKKEDSSSFAHIVPMDAYDAILPDKFALSFSMKHGKGTKEEQKNKEHILCESDEQGMNRHHFAVYVRHCKLEVILRRESGAKEEFRAAEWRWNLPEVCDQTWHSYSLLFDGVDNVELVIDGKTFKHDDRNPEILDDWPLHKTTQVKTRLVVGACWHGRSLALAQFFKGSISNMFLVSGKSEKSKAVECAHACPERLTIDGEAEANSDHTSLKLKATTVEAMQNLLKQVSYTNTRIDTHPGHRSVKAQVSVECAQQGKTITLPEYKGYVFVKKNADPVVSISGQSVVSADQKALHIGTPMLPGLRITVSQTGEDGEMKDITADSKLDYCKVHLKPSRDMDLEYFSSPATLIASTKIDFEHDKQGMMLRGADWTATYKDVLEKIHYFNTRPDAYSKRIYAVQCAMQEGRILSNEFIVTMSIDASPETDLPVTDDTSSEELAKHFEPAFDQIGGARLQNILEMELPRPKALLSHHGYDMGQGAVAGGAVAVVVVVCVGFLLVLLVVGVLKMRDTPVPKRHRRNRRTQETSGMEWDDAGMNITVNPLDDVEKNLGGQAEFSDEESSDGDDSECSYHDEEEEISEDDEEEETEILPVNHQAPPLEWDDEEEGSPSTALTPSSSSTPRPPSARSYRV